MLTLLFQNNLGDESSFSYESSGSITISGDAQNTSTYIYTTDGGLLIDNSSDLIVNRSYLSSGTINFFGTVNRVISQTFNSNDTWQCPLNVSSVVVHCWGAGAGGGNGVGSFGGGGGGGGAYAKGIVVVTPTTNYDITVGQGGTTLNDGEDSSFETFVIAKGGKHGTSSAVPATIGVGGAGGLSSECTGDIAYSGGTGGSGNASFGGGGGSSAGYYSDGSDGSITAGGGIAPFGGGNGGDRHASGGTGHSGSIPGGGGGSLKVGTGGSGADGQVILTYEIPDVLLTLSYDTPSSGLIINNSSDAEMTASEYIATGGLTLNDTSSVYVRITYESNGNLTISNSTDIQLNYNYQASGNLFLSENSTETLNTFYNSSGNLTIGGTSNSTFLFTHIADGKMSLSESTSPESLTILINANGGLTLNESADVEKSTYNYMAGGVITLISQDLERGTDVKQLPANNFWNLIEDGIAQRNQSRSSCYTSISTTAFLSLLNNDNIRTKIEISSSWRVVCYRGKGIFDIEIDGIRYDVNTLESLKRTRPTPLATNIIVGQSVHKARYEKTTIPKDTVLAMAGSESFLNLIPKDKWTVLGIRNGTVEVQLIENGFTFSVN